MKLTNPTDRQLDAAFAEHVAKQMPTGSPGYFTLPGVRGFWPAEKYTQSADAVFPWLDKGYWHVDSGEGECIVAVRDAAKKAFPEWWSDADGYQRSAGFPRAAVLALLESKGVEVEFTK
jgi:hypothetical protein